MHERMNDPVKDPALDVDPAGLDLSDQDGGQFLASAFAAGGLASKVIPDFEERQEQINMALAVWETIGSSGRLLVEAGTGTGKSLAYLLPCAIWSLKARKRAVISTYTVNLQEQLVSKDLPIVRRLLEEAGLSLEYDLLKGRNHYLCIRRWNQAYGETARTTSLVVASHEEKIIESLFDLIEGGDWTGERTALPEPVPDQVWQTVSSDSERCMSSKCPYKDRCFYQNQRKRLEQCNLVVVNHSLLAAHYLVSQETGGQVRIIPQFDCIVVDESHHLEDVTRKSLGAEVSLSRFRRLVDDTVRTASGGTLGASLESKDRKNLRNKLDEISADLSRILLDISSIIPRGKDKARQRKPNAIDSSLITRLRSLAREMKDWMDLNLSDEERFEVQALQRRLIALTMDIESVNNLEGDGDSFVYWAESVTGPRKGPVVLKRSPLEVGPYLQEVAWIPLNSAIFTSATLATGGNFDYLKEMLGLEDAREMILGSPFDYENQACLCLPSSGHDGDVNSNAFTEYVASQVLDIVDLTYGRAFILFTNKRSLHTVAELIQDKIEEKGYPVLKQGDAPREILLEEFRSQGKAVLFGLDSFWEGVDVPGDALSCVVLVKLPFPVPDDPVMEAREEIWKSKGLSPFTHYSLPVTALKLKQGFGRLIRTRTDRGAVVLLDPRVLSRSYGKFILKSLPPARITRDLDDVARAVSKPRSLP